MLRSWEIPMWTSLWDRYSALDCVFVRAQKSCSKGVLGVFSPGVKGKRMWNVVGTLVPGFLMAFGNQLELCGAA